MRSHANEDGAVTSSAVVPKAAPRRRLKGGSDVTFVVVSDTHFGYADMMAQNRTLVAKLNRIEGHPYPPPSREGILGKVGEPRGLLITGDLTEWGIGGPRCSSKSGGRP